MTGGAGPGPRVVRLEGEQDAVAAAPVCELGCAASVLKRHGVDAVGEVVGAEWSLEVATRRMTTVPQRFAERSDVAVSAQGAGWRAVAERVTGVVLHDATAARNDYLDAVAEADARGGALLLVDDAALPWLTYAQTNPGLLPHGLALHRRRPGPGASEVIEVIEGQSWWAGVYVLPAAVLLSAAFPERDVHGLSGRYFRFDVRGLRDRPDRLAEAADALRSSAQRTGARAGHAPQVQETPFGTLTVRAGADAAAAGLQAYGDLRYVCGLAALDTLEGDAARDYQFGRYTFFRLAEELAFTAYARSASAALLRRVGGIDDAVRAAVDEAVALWRRLWRQAEVLAARPAHEHLDRVLAGWEGATATDGAAARAVADALGAARTGGLRGRFGS